MARLDLSFLGAFRATLDGRPLTRFRSANNQGLLVYLALHADRPIARETLAALFWPDEPDTAAHNNLRQAIYQLRHLLGDGDDAPVPFLLISRQTAQFNPAADFTLDVARFLQAIEARDLNAGVTEYRGELLPGFTCDSVEFEAWLRLEREQLHRLALEAMAEAARDHLAAGRLGVAQALAHRQLTLEPWREVAHRQLMQAYALAGDRAAAVAQYEMAREQLHDELGVAPSPETTALLEEIRAGRFSRAITDEAIRPPARTRHNLPADTTPFIGRELELAEIGRLLTEEGRRLVTIVGPGGMGKTRLALAVGASLLGQFVDGVYFVDLAPLERPADIAPAIAAALEYQPPDPSLELTGQLLAALARQKLLLILDNFEHLLAGAPLVTELLRACPGVSVLVTSRERLSLSSESRYELGGLEYPPTLTSDDALAYTAVRLFVDSARRVRPDFALGDDNLADVVRVCRLVQGMPLALLLAAGWLELLTPAEIAAEIERGLEFLAADLSDLPGRQRSMHAVFECSWRGLSPEEQSVMARLSIFRGGFTREAAEAVAGANLRLLLALVNKSLLRRRPADGRFDVHELLRQYAAAQRRQIDPGGLAELAHCREFARLVDRAIRGAGTPFPVFVPEGLAAEIDNIRRAWAYAVERGLADELMKLAGGIYAIGFIEGSHPRIPLEEGWQSLRRHGLPEIHPAVLRLRLIMLRSLYGFNELARVKEVFLEFVPQAEACGDPELLYWLYMEVAHIFDDDGQGPEALAWMERAKGASRRISEPLYALQAEANELWIKVNSNLPDDTAPSHLEEILTALEARVSAPDLVNFGLLRSLSYRYRARNDYELALSYAMRCLNTAKCWRNLYAIGGSTANLAELRLETGHPALAAEHLLDNLEWHLAIGQVWQTLGGIFSMLLRFTPLFGGAAVAVPMLSMVYHHPEAIPLYREIITADRPRLEAEMGADAFAAAWQRGQSLSFDAVVARMRALLSPGTSI